MLSTYSDESQNLKVQKCHFIKLNLYIYIIQNKCCIITDKLTRGNKSVALNQDIKVDCTLTRRNKIVKNILHWNYIYVGCHAWKYLCRHNKQFQ